MCAGAAITANNEVSVSPCGPNLRWSPNGAGNSRTVSSPGGSTETLRLDQGKLYHFLCKFTVGDDCWDWQKGKDANGYGQHYVNLSEGGKVLYAHRVSYMLFVGPILHEMVIDHTCRNPACVNPEHLEQVTRGENVRRGVAGVQNGTKTHCPWGHEYNEENTITTKPRGHNPNGGRACRTCSNARSLARYHARKAKR